MSKPGASALFSMSARGNRPRVPQATLVELPELPHADKYDQSEYEVLLHELKADMAAYLAEYAPGAQVKTLADIIAFNERNKAKVMPWFGQEHLIAAQAKGTLDSPEYLQARGAGLRAAREEGIDKVLREHRLDALVAPTGGLPWMNDLIKGDASGGGTVASNGAGSTANGAAP